MSAVRVFNIEAGLPTLDEARRLVIAEIKHAKRDRGTSSLALFTTPGVAVQPGRGLGPLLVMRCPLREAEP